MPFNLPHNAVWIVTGCSSGIGEALATHIAHSSHRIVATARKIESLSYLPDSANVLKLKLDVTSHEDVKAAFKAAIDKFGRVDVVVNNAGYGLYSDAEGIPEKDARDQMETNFWGAVTVTNEAVRVFRDINPKGAGGLVIQVSSAGGYAGFPGGAYYHASKFALEGFTESFAKEVDPNWNINFLIIEPGGVKTKWAGGNMIHAPRHPAYENSPGCAYNHMLAYLSSQEAQSKWAEPAVVAKVIFDVVDNANTRPLPLRLPLGSDSYALLRGENDAVSKSFDEWADVSNSCSDEEQLKSIAFLRQ